MDLILQEQILQSCFKEVVIFLRERKFQSVEELVKAGETYSVAHPGSPIARKSVSNLWNESATANECLRLHPSTSSPVPVFVYLRPHLSPSSSVSVLICLRRGARWLVQRASAVCPMFYIMGLETTVACVF